MAPLLWTQRQDIGPAARFGHAMAFDTARGRTVLFGGVAGGSNLNDTWEWDGADWTQIQDIGPPPRSLTALAFDSKRARTVLFGGEGNAGSLLGDTWEWDGDEWTQVQDVGPSARSGHAMAFDSNQQRTLLFGGRSSGGLTGDTWQWDGAAWTQVEDTGPAVRELHAMVYVADRDRTVLFGGDGGSGNALGDTWEWDATHWTHVQDVGPAREGSAMAFTGGSTALFGGSSGTQANPAALFGDTWEWDGQQWVERQDMGPQERWLHAMAFDSVRGRLVLFGGTPALSRDSSLGDTWEAVGPVTDSGVVVLAQLVVEKGIGGAAILGKVTLSGPAPSGGVMVQLSFNPAGGGPLSADGTPLAGPPWLLPISGGASVGSFAELFPTSGTLTVTAKLGDVTKTVSLNTSG